MSITKEQIQKQITELVALRGNYHFKLNSVILTIFKGIKLDSLDWTIINELHKSLKGGDRKRLQEYVSQYTPLNYSSSEGCFKKPEKAKWVDLNLVLLANNSFQDFIKTSKIITEKVNVLDESGNVQYDDNGDIKTKVEEVDTKKYDLVKKGKSMINHAKKQLDDFDESGIVDPVIREKLVAFRIMANEIAIEMEFISK